jgi:hypothetical protein
MGKMSSSCDGTKTTGSGENLTNGQKQGDHFTSAVQHKYCNSCTQLVTFYEDDLWIFFFLISLNIL